MTFTIHTGSWERGRRLRRELRTLREELALQLRFLGELTYAAHCGDLSGSAKLKELLEYLDSLHAQLEACHRELGALPKSVERL